MKDWEYKRKKRPVYTQADGEWDKTEDSFLDGLDLKWAIEREYKNNPRLVGMDPEIVARGIQSKSTEWIIPRDAYIYRRRFHPWPLGALGQLSPQQKQVWIMRKHQGLDQDEIAEYMGISRQQVSKLEKSARLKIKKLGLECESAQPLNLLNLNKLFQKRLVKSRIGRKTKK